MTAPFTVRYRVRFAHCDPAGIAYYPRYFELCDAAVEDWCEEALGVSRSKLHMEWRLGLPTVDLHANFRAVSRLGDWLDIAIEIASVGRTSIDLIARVSCEGDPRFTVEYKQVLMDLAETRAVPWPQELRDRLVSAATKEKAA